MKITKEQYNALNNLCNYYGSLDRSEDEDNIFEGLQVCLKNQDGDI